MILLPSTRQRIARVPLLFRAHDCVDETGLFALSYGRKIHATFTRTGAAAIEDQAGRLVRLPGAMPRVAFVPRSVGRVRVLLLEPYNTTNLSLWSQAADNAAWTKSRATISPNADIAPDGTPTADRLIEDATASASHRLYDAATVTITANANIFVGRFVKAGTRSWVLLGPINFNESVGARTYFDVANGVIGTTHLAGTGAVVASGMDSLGNGWYFCWVIGNLGGGLTAALNYCGLASANGTQSYTGDGASYVSIWGAMTVDNAEGAGVAGTRIHSYVPTEGATATRNAESLYFPLSLVPQAGTLYQRSVNRGLYAAGTATRYGAHLGAANKDTDPRFALYALITGQMGALYDDGATQVDSTVGSAQAHGVIVEHLGTLSADWRVQVTRSYDGDAPVSGTLSGATGSSGAWAEGKFWLSDTSGAQAQKAVTHAALAGAGASLDELRDLCEVG